MAHVEEHLQLSELEGRYRSASEATEARHFQVIWLLAKGHTVGEVSEMTSSANAGSNNCFLATTSSARRRWAIPTLKRLRGDDPEARKSWRC